MTTDPFTTAARVVGADPGEVRESMRNALAHSEQNGITDAELLAWVWHAGAVWARGMEAVRAAQEPTDADVLAALNAQGVVMYPKMHPAPSLDYWGDKPAEAMRAALSAARAARRDEERQP